MSLRDPPSAETSRRMAKVRQKATGAEVALRRELYRIGLRYRVDCEVLKKPRRVADIAFPGRRIAIFVDGCFWHGCPEHATWPKRNAEFWRQKIEANQQRDADTNERLRSLGWTVLRFWSHESPIDAAKVVANAVAIIDGKRRTASYGVNDKN
ncbi:very short patch repair endonuclease [Burkholderia stabilis]|uniref:very short patch repair endonuclease n=1 Tax=Burkholderia stabilis TaxID=95485 RepID=UPI0009F57CFE|nr:very short patch repair endonuclease [Burkholderia stabilis]HDR9495206.1 very short patch repair endonuclease [Burkholderia stabilis]HDR9526927.1 very short patch repair endonuclease [Burkholderia stabilis]HDR9534273.1 very short patch repair endonuclease [Burkholderia stabilis]HDR9542550.1 very short patch repair endonuclease [Burkholderia stabilis]HDR9549699.1 very short patch repair endonuclease [Burkholderia stabilis]